MANHPATKAILQFALIQSFRMYLMWEKQYGIQKAKGDSWNASAG
jgi:hypothetical protein